MYYIDSHCHLLSEEYEQDLDQVVEHCKENGVKRVLLITLSEQETKKALQLHDQDPFFFQVAAGVYPLDVYDQTEEDWQRLFQLVQDERICAIGEIGLEYHFEQYPIKRELQKQAFIRQIEMAKQVNKPFIVHSRDAIQDTYQIMKEHHTKGLLHCFPGSKEMAKEFTKLGYYIALGGALTFKNARHSVEVCQNIDLQYLLSETDSPYMAPVPMRGKRNEPTYIPYIVAKMAEVRGQSVETIRDQIALNYARFLGEI